MRCLCSLVDISWRLALSGIGQGLFLSPNTRTVMGAAPPEQTGMVSGLVATTRVVGQSLSVAVAGAVFTGLGGAAAGEALAAARAVGAREAVEVAALEATFLHALRGAIVVCGALAAAGAQCSAWPAVTSGSGSAGGIPSPRRRSAATRSVAGAGGCRRP